MKASATTAQLHPVTHPVILVMSGLRMESHGLRQSNIFQELNLPGSLVDKAIGGQHFL